MQTTLMIVTCTAVGLTGCVSKNGAATRPSTPADETVAVRAFELRMAGKVAEAKAFLEEKLASDPANGPAQFELARDYFYTMMEPPESSSSKAGQTQESPKHRTQRALEYNLSRARKAIHKAVEIEPDNPRYHFWASRIAVYSSVHKMHSFWTTLDGCGQAQQSVQSLERAVALKPDYHEARLELMGYYDRLPWICGGNKFKAKKHAKELEQRDPVYGVRARCELRPRKTYEEKLALWAKVVADSPDRADAHTGIARQYLGADTVQEMDKAVAHIDTALELDPSRSVILLDLGRRYSSLKAFDKAEEATRRFLEFDPLPPVALRACGLRQLARIQRKQDKEQEAEASLAEADKLDPTNWPSSRWLPPDDLYVAP